MDEFEKRGFEETVNMSDSNEVILELEGYNDLFSDFDPRGYDEKALSVDFLSELKRASKDKSDVKKLVLLAPKPVRNSGKELTIRRRLKEHFNRHFLLSKKERGKIVNRGIGFVIAGIIFMFLATYLLFHYGDKTFLISFLIILLEPAGWFSFWEGLNQIIFDAKRETPEFKFYKKMTECAVYFRGY